MISKTEVSPGDVINYGMHSKFKQPLQLISLAVVCVKLPLCGVYVLGSDHGHIWTSWTERERQ